MCSAGSRRAAELARRYSQSGIQEGAARWVGEKMARGDGARGGHAWGHGANTHKQVAEFSARALHGASINLFSFNPSREVSRSRSPAAVELDGLLTVHC